MLWFVIFSPLLTAFLGAFFVPKTKPLLSQLVATTGVGVAFLAGLCLFITRSSEDFAPIHYTLMPWMSAGEFQVDFSFLVDRLSLMMVLIITGIGTLIHIYARGYLHEEKSLSRFYAYLNLFVFMMLLLVLGDNFLVMFIGWEGVGLCSYLLIGYWFSESANAAAGMKAFLVNRIGDIGLLLGMFTAFILWGTLDFEKILSTNLMPSPWITFMTICLFVGATGKSAQLPLYVWLPDAMAGPTPVSALIHAATMVTAGVYMMTRLNPLFYLSPVTMTIVAIIGALTALFAASIAIVQRDIKKVLAYSTVSQLGFMVLGCGVGAFDAGAFHLLTHACFKALMFLGAGSVIVASHHNQDMFYMGGLREKMPITYKTFLVGVLAIIGFPGLAGFFSKDEILWRAFTAPGIGPFLWGTATLAALMTAFYMVRLFCLTFLGKDRSHEAHHHDDHHGGHHHHEAHETGSDMYGPLVVLALLSIVVGYLGIPPVIGHVVHVDNFFAHYLEPLMRIPESMGDRWSYLSAHYSPTLEWALMLLSTGLAMSSAFVAFTLYKNGPTPFHAQVAKKYAGAFKLLEGKYWVDELYDSVFVRSLRDMARFCFEIIDLKALGQGLVILGRSFTVVAGLLSFSAKGLIGRYAALACFAWLFFLIFII